MMCLCRFHHVQQKAGAGMALESILTHHRTGDYGVAIHAGQKAGERIFLPHDHSGATARLISLHDVNRVA